MDVVRHHPPRDEPVTLQVEMEERFLDQRRDSIVPQPTGAVSDILIRVDPLPQDVHRTSVRIQTPIPDTELGFPAFDHVERNGIKQVYV